MDQNRIDRNILFAEFLGWTKCDCGQQPEHYKYGPERWQTMDVDKMKFSTSWNDFMPIARKIRDLAPGKELVSLLPMPDTSMWKLLGAICEIDLQAANEAAEEWILNYKVKQQKQ